jgi:hypothetical protein
LRKYKDVQRNELATTVCAFSFGFSNNKTTTILHGYTVAVQGGKRQPGMLNSVERVHVCFRKRQFVQFKQSFLLVGNHLADSVFVVDVPIMAATSCTGKQ